MMVDIILCPKTGAPTVNEWKEIGNIQTKHPLVQFPFLHQGVYCGVYYDDTFDTTVKNTSTRRKFEIFGTNTTSIESY